MIVTAKLERKVWLSFAGCRDSSRLGNLLDVETKTHWDWGICWMSRRRPVETGQKMLKQRLHQEFRWSLVYQRAVVTRILKFWWIEAEKWGIQNLESKTYFSTIIGFKGYDFYHFFFFIKLVVLKMSFLIIFPIYRHFSPFYRLWLNKVRSLKILGGLENQVG